MSNVLKLSGPIKVGSLSADPPNPQEGYIYFNTSSGIFRLYENGAFRDVSAEALEAHLNGGPSKHDATEIDYERVDGSKKNIQAASDDVETALTDLDDAIGALDATPTNYTPADPAIVADHLAAIDTALATSGSTEYADDVFRVNDNVDPTKQLAFEVGGLSTSTIRTVTIPDSNVNLGDIAANASDIADIRTTQGTSDGDTNLGTFTGSTIPDSSTVKGALQSLEVEVELKANDADVIKKDGSVAFTGAQSLGGFKLTSVADPTSPQDAATKAYVDATIEGLKPKEAVRVATTAAGTLATDFENGDAIDGVTLVTGDRILIKDQAAPAENGIYIVQASGAPVRADDFNELSPIDEINGAMVPVQEGTANAGKIYVQQGTVSTIDTDSIVFVYFNSNAALIGGDGISISGSNVSVDHDGEGLTFVTGQLALELDGATLSKSASGVKVADGGIGDTQVSSLSATKIGNGDVDNTELSYVNGVTSSIQTQLNAKLENVIEDVTPELGGNLEVGTFAIEGASNPVLLAGQNAVRRAKQASKSSYVEEEYIHNLALAGSQTNAVISALTFAHGTYEAIEIVYKLKENTSGDIRIGTIRVATNGTAVVLNDVSTDTADTGIEFSAAINGSNVEVRYTSGSNGAVMRADVKKILA